MRLLPPICLAAALSPVALTMLGLMPGKVEGRLGASTSHQQQEGENPHLGVDDLLGRLLEKDAGLSMPGTTSTHAPAIPAGIMPYHTASPARTMSPTSGTETVAPASFFPGTPGAMPTTPPPTAGMPDNTPTVVPASTPVGSTQSPVVSTGLPLNHTGSATLGPVSFPGTPGIPTGSTTQSPSSIVSMGPGTPTMAPTPFPGGTPNSCPNNGESKQCCGSTTNVTVGVVGLPLVVKPGVTALEYLGTGYHIFEGNPRGGAVTELDPGFRNGVIKLVVNQGQRTQNNEFVVPLGTEVRFTTACMFSSSSTEVATTAQYQEELSSEAMMSASLSASASGWGASINAETAFSFSSKFNSFASDRSTSQTTTFQSKAFCTEFEARMQRYHQHQLQDAFLVALEGLPSTFDETNQDHLLLFGNFLLEYGTHYVSHVVLGAKQIYSAEMQSSSVLALREMGYSVSDSLSAKVMFGYSGYGVSAEASVGANSSSTSSGNQMALNEINKRTQKVVETNVGGTPPGDGKWQTWAETAKSRPMPIQYELTELSEIMPEDKVSAYGAYLEFYIRRGRTGADQEIADVLHYGVAGPDGFPISSYTLDPRAKQRALTSLQMRREGAEDTSEEFYRYDILWEGSNSVESAVFVTLIRDNLSPNEDEDFFEVNLLNQNDFRPTGLLIPFVLRSAVGSSRVTAAIYGARDASNLNSFSYLASDNLPGNAQYVAGVVHAQGYPINNVFGSNVGFDIRQRNDREFIVDFTELFAEPPTFVLSPLWFPTLENAYPSDIGDIVLASRGCSTTSCRLQVGGFVPNPDAGPNPREARFLGFNMLALDSDLITTGIIHGRVVMGAEQPPIVLEPLNGQGRNFNATVIVGKVPLFAILGTTFELEFYGGVLIEFSNEFQDIPSVIVTPEIRDDEEMKSNGTAYTYPYAIVEHITRKQVLIKSAILDYDGNEGFQYRLTSFSFVATGPQTL